MNFLLKRNRSLAMAVVVMLMSVNSAKADVLDDVKAVYIYNFLSFVQWPSSLALDDGDYQICIAENGDSITNKLRTVVTGETVNGRLINVQSLKESAACHILYIDRRSQIEEAQLDKMKRSGTLLVSDASGFVSSGGMVGFETRGRKVRVAMNLTELDKVGFKVSSKLLRLVRIER